MIRSGPVYDSTALPPSSLGSYGDDIEIVRRRLRHVRFIGGGSGSGKTTVARRLAAEHGLVIYETERFSEYLDRMTPDEAPLLHRFVAMDMDERWVDRDPHEMRDTFHGFHGEGFQLVIDDLLALPQETSVLVEGFTLLPRLVAPLLTRRHQAIWLIASPAFRRAAFDSRGSTYDIAGRTSDPERALANLLERDRLFGEDVAREAAAVGLPLIHVDVGMSVDELTARASAALSLA